MIRCNKGGEAIRVYGGDLHWASLTVVTSENTVRWAPPVACTTVSRAPTLRHAADSQSEIQFCTPPRPTTSSSATSTSAARSHSRR